jgi:hypothetical protein
LDATQATIKLVIFAYSRRVATLIARTCRSPRPGLLPTCLADGEPEPRCCGRISSACRSTLVTRATNDHRTQSRARMTPKGMMVLQTPYEPCFCPEKRLTDLTEPDSDLRWINTKVRNRTTAELVIQTGRSARIPPRSACPAPAAACPRRSASSRGSRRSYSSAGNAPQSR